jgi:hypothetical protein
MSITTRDLKLRQKEVEKNLNETYSTLRKQPEGGLGAMIQKPNHNEPPLRRVPTLFTPSPMLSSLPYLAEWVKVRSNEVAINTTAHLIRQREAAKASFLYDDIKQNNIDMRNEEVAATVSRNFSPSTADLLRKYLSNEIDKSRDGERKIQEERMKRVDLQMNPVRADQPAPAPPILRTLTSGDVGRPNIPDQAQLRELRNQFYDRQEQGRQYDEMQRQALLGADETIKATIARYRQGQAVANEAKDQAVKRKFTTLSEGLIANENGRNMGTLDMVQQLRKFKEDQIRENLLKYNKESLGKQARQMLPFGEERPNIPVQVKKKGEVIRTEIRPASNAELLQGGFLTKESLIRAKAKNPKFIIPSIPEEGKKTYGESQKAQLGSVLKFGKGYQKELRDAARAAAGGGGGGGGGGGAAVAQAFERLAKGVV